MRHQPAQGRGVEPAAASREEERVRPRRVRAAAGPRAGNARPSAPPPRRAARSAPCRPCRAARGRAPARSRRRRGRARPPRRCAGRPSRRARAAPGCAAPSGPSPSNASRIASTSSRLRRVRQASRPRRGASDDVRDARRAEREAQQRPHRGEPPGDRRRRELAAGPGAAEVGDVVGQDADVDVLDLAVRRTTRRTRARSARRRAGSTRRSPAAARKRSICFFERHPHRFARRVRSPAVDDRFEALAEIAVHGANVQPGQIFAVSASSGQEELARAVAAAAYDRGATFVDVVYFDPLREARADRSTRRPRRSTTFPAGTASGCSALAERRGARISFAGTAAPNPLDGLDPALVGRDQLPWLKETGEGRQRPVDELDDRPVPASRVGASSSTPISRRTTRTSGSGRSSSTSSGSTSPTRRGLGQRMATLNASAPSLTDRRFDAFELRGPGTELTVGLLPTGTWWAADFDDGRRPAALPEPADRGGVHHPRPGADRGARHVDQAARAQDGTIVRGLRVRFEAGRPSRSTADENAEALRAQHRTSTRARSRWASWRSSTGTAGSARSGRSSTTRCSTRTPPATSRSASASRSPSTDEDAERMNTSGIHIDFMIGSPELEVDGVTPTATGFRCCATATGRSSRQPSGRSGTARRHCMPAHYHSPSVSLAARLRTELESLDPARACWPGPRRHRSAGTATDAALLYTHALRAARACCAEGGPLVVDTGQLHRPLAQGQVRRRASPAPRTGSGGATVNQPIVGGALRRAAREGRRVPRASSDLYVVDAFAGADPAHRIAVRVITAQPVPRALREDDVHRPDRTTSSTASSRRRSSCTRPSVEADPDEDGTRTRTFIVLHPARSEVLIGGTFYAGEIKKSIFTRDERPAAARGRPPDALLGERRRPTGASRSSSASRAPARRRSRPTRSAR